MISVLWANRAQGITQHAGCVEGSDGHVSTLNWRHAVIRQPFNDHI